MDTSQDLRGFSQFLADRVAAGADALPEEFVAEWRNEHPLPIELEDSVRDLRASLEDLASGRTRDFDEVNAEVRQRHGWTAN